VQQSLLQHGIYALKEQIMSTTRKSTKSAEKDEAMESFFPFFIRSVERIAEFQKKSLEFAAQQNADLSENVKKAAKVWPEAPGTFVFDLYAQAFDKIVETQKSAIDLVVEQSQQAVNLTKERGTSYGKATEGFSSLIQHTVDQTIAAQKKALDFVAEQQKATYDTVKQQFRFANTPAAEAFQNGLDTLIETQKAILDIASKPLHTAAQ
jgi:Zn-dependent M32 family carboxypeptidase